MRIQPNSEVFFGPVFCASLYSYLHNTPAGLNILKEKDAVKQLSIALTAVLGEQASKWSISHFISGEGRLEVSNHVDKVKRLLSDQMDFEIKHPSNHEIFYSQTGMPRGFFIEGLSPKNEEFLNNLLIDQHLIISSAEMKALGFDGSDPYPVINKITSLQDGIALAAKNGSVCVIAESEKLQKLKKIIPKPVSLSPTQAIAILYKAEFKEQKYENSLESLQTIKPNSTQLSEAFTKLSIRCHVDSENSENSENWEIFALPEEHAKIHKIYDECLQPLDKNLCQDILLEAEADEEKITAETITRLLDNDKFVLLPGPAIIADSSVLKKIRELQREWLDIDSDHINLLKHMNPQREDEADDINSKRVIYHLREMAIIPLELSLEVRENPDGGFKILAPLKYNNKIIKTLTTLFSEHSLEATPQIMKTLYEQTGIREIKPAFAKLQEDKRVHDGFVTLKDNKNYLVFTEEEDKEKFENYWIRHFVSINSLCKTVIKLEAKSQGCRNEDFESCCHYLKIIAEHSSHYFNFRWCIGPQNMIKIDNENLQKLNNFLASYVSFTPKVHNFIITLLPHMRESGPWQMIQESKQYVVSKKTIEKIFEDVMAVIPSLCKSTLTGKVIEKTPCVATDNEIWDLADLKEDRGLIKLSQLEEYISNWKVTHNFVPLEYHKLPPISENPESEKYLLRRTSTVSDTGRNMQTFATVRKSTTLSSSNYSLLLSDSKTNLNTEFSPDPKSYSRNSSFDPAPTPNQQPGSGPGSDVRFIGGRNPSSSSSVSNQSPTPEVISSSILQPPGT